MPSSVQVRSLPSTPQPSTSRLPMQPSKPPAFAPSNGTTSSPLTPARQVMSPSFPPPPSFSQPLQPMSATSPSTTFMSTLSPQPQMVRSHSAQAARPNYDILLPSTAPITPQTFFSTPMQASAPPLAPSRPPTFGGAQGVLKPSAPPAPKWGTGAGQKGKQDWGDFDPLG